MKNYQEFDSQQLTGCDTIEVYRKVMPVKTRYPEFELYMSTHEKTPVKQVMKDLGISEPTYFRHLRTYKSVPRSSRRLISEYELPGSILVKNLPSSEYSWVHLASYLTKFSHSEKIPPYNKTKSEILLDIRKSLETDPNLAADLVFGLHNNLALYALFTGEISAFANMRGNCVPPTNYLSPGL